MTEPHNDPTSTVSGGCNGFRPTATMTPRVLIATKTDVSGF